MPVGSAGRAAGRLGPRREPGARGLGTGARCWARAQLSACRARAEPLLCRPRGGGRRGEGGREDREAPGRPPPLGRASAGWRGRAPLFFMRPQVEKGEQ